MVATYTVFGRQVGSHVLAMITLGTVAVVPMFMGGGGAKKADLPPLNAGSKDEEKFIQEFLQSVEKEDSKAKAS